MSMLPDPIAAARGTRTTIGGGVVGTAGFEGDGFAGHSDQTTSAASATTESTTPAPDSHAFNRRLAFASGVIATGPEIASGLSRMRTRSDALRGRSAGSFSR